MTQNGNRVYIASKAGPMDEEVRALMETLQSRGYEFIYDWTSQAIPKPFIENQAEARQAAVAMVDTVMQCDILIVLCAPNGLGMHIETGVALGVSMVLSFIHGKEFKRIYIVGAENARSLFYFHPSATRIPDVESLLELLPEVRE